MFGGWSFDRLWFVGSPLQCSPIVVYCDLLVPMVSLHLQVVGLRSEAIFWMGKPLYTGWFSYVY